MSYRRHSTSKFARKQHHKRLKKRMRGTGLFPYSDGRGMSKRALSRQSKRVEHMAEAMRRRA